MRYIQVPLDIEVPLLSAFLAANPDQKPSKFSFLKFATFCWLEDQRAISEGDKMSNTKLRRWAKVIEKFEACLPGKYIELEDEDWKTLEAISKSPLARFGVTVMIACTPFVDAVLDARTERPSVVSET